LAAEEMPTTKGPAAALETVLKADRARDATAIGSGVTVPFTLPLVSVTTHFVGDYSYTLQIPAGTTQVVFELRTQTPNADVDLYVRRDVDVQRASNGRPIADYISEGLTGNETITIQNPPAGTYYIAFGLFSLFVSPSCTIRAVVTAPAPSGSYNGTWSGTTGQGRPITITVENNTVTHVDYGVNFSLGFSCPSSADVTRNVNFAITGGSASGTDFTGLFGSSSASGTLRHVLNIPFPQNCVQTINTTWAANLTGTPPPPPPPVLYSFGGTVRDAVTNLPVSGVLLTLSGGASQSMQTQSSGTYQFSNLTSGLNYTVTPSKLGCMFNPLLRVRSPLNSNQLAEDFTVTCEISTFTISGQVRDLANQPVSGVLISLTGGANQSIQTSGSGEFQFTNLTSGLNYTVTPSKATCVFTPNNRVINGLGSNLAGQDFSANCPVTSSISGQVRDGTSAGVTGVLLNLTGGANQTVQTGASGEFQFTNLTGGQSYTITPSKSGCNFTPPSRSFSPLNNNTAGADFTAICESSGTFSIGGTVRDTTGVPVSGVELNLSGGSSQLAVSKATGDYLLPGLAPGLSYTVRPTKPGCLFNPENRFYGNLSSTQTFQDYTATCDSIGPITSALSFIPVTPCRVADTRAGQGKFGAFGPPTPLGGTTREIPIPQSTCGIPASAQAYSLNFTVVPQGLLSFLSTWPSGQSLPLVSTLNSFHGGIVANAAIVPAGPNGAINVFVTEAADVIVDINGYFDAPSTAGALDFFPLSPCRTADTRGGFAGAFGPPTLFGVTTRLLPLLAGNCGLPASARAYSLNATVVPPGPLSYLTLFPAGATQPVVSTLNSFDGVIVANAAIVPGGNGGAINAFVTDRTDLVLDLNGYFAPPAVGSLKFYPVTPCRLADTRAGQGPILTGNTSRTFQVGGLCGIPTNAQAFSLNVTVVPSGQLAYLTLWPAGQGQPLVSTLNSFQGRVLANAAIVPAGLNGSVSVYVTNNTHVILDINGYFAP
jgi:hypothetical protein